MRGGDGGTRPRGRTAWSGALLLLAALAVAWIRLLPLGVPAIAGQAQRLARSEVAARLARDAQPPAPAAVEAWIASHPEAFAAAVAAQEVRLRAAFTDVDGAGRRHAYLGDYDSYAWLRGARALLRDGRECDRVADGVCRDTLTLAPLGTAMRYAGSPHTAAIAALHRVLAWIDPYQPLPVSAFFLQVLVGVLGVPPAFALGRRLAGALGGFVAALVANLQPMFLLRSLGSDNDVWNVVVPLWMVWALAVALRARRASRRAAAALAAAALVGLHAAIWRGWIFGVAVASAGLAAALVLHALRAMRAPHAARAERTAALRHTAVVLAIYAPAALLAAWLAGAELPAWPAAAAPAPPAGALAWPSALSLVGELSVPSLGGIAVHAYGALLFFVGWLGMLLAVLPRGTWQTGHFLVLIGGTVLYRLLLTASGIGAWTLAGLLALPLAAAVAVQVRTGDDADAEAAALGLVVAIWLLAALVMAYDAARFVLLLAAPLGIATGVAAGRFGDWLTEQIKDALGARSAFRFPLSAALPRLLATAAVLAFAALPLRAGHAVATAYLPAIDRAWVETLAMLRGRTPPDAIVSAWWDYGYWIKYFAERRVNADGGTLRTRVPLWLARAQTAASEAETVGLLRMLDCGADADPYPEGAHGAMGRLRAHGIDEATAFALVTRIVSLPRDAADGALAAAGLDAAARADVLATTHCTPPPAYLVLSSAQAQLTPWWRFGAWRPGTDGAPPDDGLATRAWRDCAVDGAARTCRIGGRLPDGRLIASVRFTPAAPADTAVVVGTAASRQTLRPSLVLLATADGIERVPRGDGDPRLAVLIDVAAARVLVGTPAALDSTYTRLMFLDGRGLRHFRKFSDYTGAFDTRVVTYEIQWPEETTADSADRTDSVDSDTSSA